MHRRAFVRWAGSACAAAAVGAGSGRWAAAVPASPLIDPLRDICRIPPTAVAAGPVASDDTLIIGGTRLLKDGFLDRMALGYREATGRMIKVLGGGCDDGIIPVKEGRMHLGAMCCEPAAGAATDGLTWRHLANDLKVVVVHPSNPVHDVSLADLRKVVKGEIQNWKDLGGVDRPVAVVAYDHCPSYAEPVRDLLLNGRPTYTPHSLRATTDDELLQMVARYEQAIGVNSWVLVEPLVASGVLKALAVDGHYPATREAPTARYPLRGAFGVVYREWDEGLMRPFFDYLYSPRGQDHIGRNLLPVAAVKPKAR